MNVLLDTVLGLGITYLFYSLLSSALVEIFAGLTQKRGMLLKEGILNMLGPHTTQQLFAHPLVASANSGTVRPSYISSRLFAIALADLTTKLIPAEPPVLGVKQNVPKPLRRSLRALMMGTQGNEIHVIDRFQRWFLEMNDDLTGRYSRTARKWNFIAAVLLTIISQVDSWQIARVLAGDSPTRMEAAAIKPNQSLKEISDRLALVRLPVGWTSFASEWEQTDGSGTVTFIIAKMLGWSATIIAVTLGSPFWFDQLNRIMNVRLGAKKPLDE